MENEFELEIRAVPLFSKRMYRIEWKTKYGGWDSWTDGALDFTTIDQCQSVAKRMREWAEKETVTL